MEKQKRWQLYLIVAVLVLTLYNILPTLFYYSNSLRDPITAPRAQEVTSQINERVNRLETEAKEWLGSYSKLLGLKPQSIAQVAQDPGLVEIQFAKPEESKRFAYFLPEAGVRIPFVPAQLELFPSSGETTLVKRQIGVHLTPEMFHYIGRDSAEYRDLVFDRVATLANAFAGPSQSGEILPAIGPENDDVVIMLAQEIVNADKTFAKSPIAQRYWGYFTQQEEGSAEIQKFITATESTRAKINAEKEALVAEQKKLKGQGLALSPSQEQTLSILEGQAQALQSAVTVMKNNSASFKATGKPLSPATLQSTLVKLPVTTTDEHFVSLEGRHPFIQGLVIDWTEEKIVLKLYDDVEAIRHAELGSESQSIQKERLNGLLINEIARAGRLADESIQPYNSDFAVSLFALPNATGFLALDLGKVAQAESQQILQQISHNWSPTHADFVRDNFPVRNWNTYQKESGETQKLGLVVYAPSIDSKAVPEGFRRGSIYVIARHAQSIVQKYQEAPNAPESKTLAADFTQLSQLLQKLNFISYSGNAFGIDPAYSKDMIFELEDYSSALLKATRENFAVKGSKTLAVLPFTDVEQRLLARNAIDDRIQEDLLKSSEEYSGAQVDLDLTNQYLIPAPTQSPFWENVKLSAKKYVRGDDRKVLKWGLDLSGGKIVRIGLRDSNNRPVTNPEDLRQASNELYTRINTMGVSEQTIRIENENILLEFPGSQSLSANDLVKASAMYFHIVNEKFGPNNRALWDLTNNFLQEVWNEAVVTNRKDAESLNEIAWKHLGGDVSDEKLNYPRSEAARLLAENGLKLANPHDKHASNAFNDTLSSIAMMRGDDYKAWYGQAHPLMVVFHNYALEGSNLTNIQVGYDPTEGNSLSFSVKGGYEGGRPGSPRDDLYAWTSQFAEEKIVGTPKALYSPSGWRMGVILNSTVINQPSLKGALRDNVSISGRFTQREISQLAADLKAGSLSFTPKILSEQNVSAELGQEERTKGIVASLVALVLVVAAMCGYYRFAGVVASVAVLLNILIMWGVLQNLDAALTLPGIAGIVLTIGMAVDANVLVFERIREEFKASGRIASAISTGYRKAFSAIVDSNITTIIAALVLIQFDSGPIKGFAVTLIIGIISSMFTALFMTRYFFAGWVQNPKNKSLTMSQFIGATHFNFLAQTRKAMLVTAVLIVGGMFLLAKQRHTILGMDFTGGYALNVEVQPPTGEESARQQALHVLAAKGANVRDLQVRELTTPNQLRITLGMGMEEKGEPFYQMAERTSDAAYSLPYQTNPRLVWVVKAIEASGLKISDIELTKIDSNWTLMSGQFSDAMRNNAVYGLGLALLGILLYISLRFEFIYAVASVIGLAHDVIITIGLLALFQALGFGVQIDLQVIGALMTIIGYSLNDTIIVFDRIREDEKMMRKSSFTEVVNHALNVTLGRTIMTSGTTLLVLLALVLLGGPSIFAFSLVMTIGVVVGTLSSLFIAAPVLLYLHNREEAKKARSVQYRKV